MSHAPLSSGPLDPSKPVGDVSALALAAGSAKWTAAKYPDCKTWTVYGEGRTIASRMTEADARCIARVPQLQSLADQVDSAERWSLDPFTGQLVRDPDGPWLMLPNK